MSNIDLIAGSLVKEMARVTAQEFLGGLFRSRDKTEEDLSAARKQVILLQELSDAGIDPRLFDLLLSSELDRHLKKQFGVAFFIATIFFTLLSYLVIILNSASKWGIPDHAITALIVETPIQFIGLLYIIARNLFPQSKGPGILEATRAMPMKKSRRKAPAPDVPRIAKQDDLGESDDHT